MEQSNTPAGRYQVPHRSWRWWDGQAWTSTQQVWQQDASGAPPQQMSPVR